MGWSDKTGKTVTFVGGTSGGIRNLSSNSYSLILNESIYLSLPSIINFTDYFTIEFWFKPRIVDGNHRYIFDFANNDGSNRLYFAYRNSTNKVAFNDFSYDYTFQVDTWYHIAITGLKSGSFRTTTLYLNGVNVSSNGGSATTLNPTENLRIGERYSPASSIFTGDIANFSISNMVRYFSDFTPSTTPPTQDANHVFLLDFTKTQKPFSATEARFEINSSAGGDGAGGRNATYLFNDNISSYPTDCFFWSSTSPTVAYMDFTTLSTTNIWTIHSSNYLDTHYQRLRLQQWNGSAFSDYIDETIPLPTTQTWTRSFSSLPAGRYRVYSPNQNRIDTEWFIEQGTEPSSPVSVCSYVVLY